MISSTNRSFSHSSISGAAHYIAAHDDTVDRVQVGHPLPHRHAVKPRQRGVQVALPVSGLLAPL